MFICGRDRWPSRCRRILASDWRSKSALDACCATNPLGVLASHFFLNAALQAKDPIDYIDPFIGTGHQGKDFPGASLPFSMVKINPITNNGLGYTYQDKTIQGFGFDQLGGADGGELGNFLVMATTGPLKIYAGDRGKPGSGYLSAFSKDTEKASAGYYEVTLDDYKVRAEATVAMHSGILRFTFPASAQARIQVDLSHRNAGTSLHQTVKVVDDHTIEGMIECTGAGGGWTFGGSTRYTAYYHAEFSKPFTKYGVSSATLPPEWSSNPPTPWGGKNGNHTSNPAFIEACKNAEVIPGCKKRRGNISASTRSFHHGE